MIIVRYIIVTIFLFVSFSGASFAEDVVIVNRNNPVNDLSAAQLKKIYNGTIQFWDDGTKIIQVDLIDSDPAAVNFANSILGVDMETKRRYWMQKIYSGSGSPPIQEKNCSKVISVVTSEPGAIGYIHASNVTPAVKVITINGKKEF